MNKKEVAEFLGITTRQVETHAAASRLGEVQYVRGKTGKQAEYSREAVEKYKAILESPDTAIATKTPDARLFVAQLADALASREQANAAVIRDLFLESREHTRNGAIRVSEKILLTFADCRLLTGLSEQSLRESIKAEKLKAKKIGRGWKVKRQDLDEFIAKL
jgi:excisionase family DNA binding protein